MINNFEVVKTRNGYLVMLRKWRADHVAFTYDDSVYSFETLKSLLAWIEDNFTPESAKAAS